MTDLLREGVAVPAVLLMLMNALQFSPLPSIFEPFAQDPAVRHLDGSGLGLAIAKALAELQHGRVDVDPGGAGRGAVFHVHLPLVRQQSASA